MLVALAGNAVLDLAFDLPMLVRWAVVVSVVLLASVLIEVRRRRVDASRADQDAV
ncbi:hypothetical protein [Modestobacter sp. SYSU DS0657]